MASWASIARAEPAPKPEAKEEDPAARPKIAVVDANAIIAGEGLLSLMRWNDRVVTVPEVLREVRDKQSRAALQNLPFSIETLEPAEDSVKAVMRFARTTGDAHALSAVDVRLVALAHTLEAQYYGTAHLRSQPPAPRVAKKKVRDSKFLPGWGAEGGEWAELDRLNEEELAAAEAAMMAGATSRIATTLQTLTLGGEGGGFLVTSQPEPAQQAEQAAPAPLSPPLAAARAPQETGAAPAESEATAAEANGAAAEAAAAAAEGEGGSDSEGESGDEEEGEEDDGRWTTAARTRNVQRRQQRRAIRRAQREAEAAAAAEQAAAHLAAGAAAEGESSGSEYTTDVESEEEEEEEGEEGVSGDEEEEQGEQRPESAVSSVTADFAMQNVLLQMGLRLVAPDGRRVSSLSRWVLRCTACYGVTKEMGRLFCPRCGNAALDKVRVVVGPDGAEQYGVRKKHVLRGTRFSLPKPKGGRANDVILREDQLIAKAHRLRKKKGGQEELDPFAPEYTDETWHTFQAAAVKGGDKGAAALLAGWKHNPNERRHVATNRRRK